MIRAVEEFKALDKTYYSFTFRLLLSILVYADRKDVDQYKRGYEYPEKTYNTWDELISIFDKHMSTFGRENDIARIRWEISDICFESAKREKGIYSLIAPTGSGKTLASLRYALEHARINKMDRVFYFIPFTSIIDQNARNIRKIFGKDVVCEHHCNVANGEISGHIYDYDTEIILSTTVQFFDIMFGSTPSTSLKMKQLMNSVIIFDESQMIPAEFKHLFASTCNYLKSMGCTIVLSTATQPDKTTIDNIQNGLIRDKFNAVGINYNDNREIITDYKKYQNILKRTNIVHKEGKYDEAMLMDLTIEQMKKENSCLVVFNVKNDMGASSFYNRIRIQVDYPVYHLSTNMCQAHRMVVLDEFRKALLDGKKVLCISTQLIEAGVDIDCDCVIRMMAGLESIHQAAGRCNREGKKGVKNVFVIDYGDDRKIKALPSIELGKKCTSIVIKNCKHPLDSQEALNYFYNNVNSDIKQFTFSDCGKKCCKYDYYDGSLSRPMSLWIALRTMKFGYAYDRIRLIDDRTFSVITQYGDAKQKISELKSLNPDSREFIMKLRELSKYQINIFYTDKNQKIQDMVNDGVIQVFDADKGIYILTEQCYHPNIGFQAKNTMSVSNLII
jgi:CRISPR-associated endonuclease/helicase Cas3